MISPACYLHLIRLSNSFINALKHVATARERDCSRTIRSRLFLSICRSLLLLTIKYYVTWVSSTPSCQCLFALIHVQVPKSSTYGQDYCVKTLVLMSYVSDTACPRTLSIHSAWAYWSAADTARLVYHEQLPGLSILPARWLSCPSESGVWTQWKARASRPRVNQDVDDC